MDSAASGGTKPNILIVICDELRSPQWFPSRPALDALLPSMASLRKSSVSFESHYTAANSCTPSRGAMVTGLYAHQTGCLFTGGGPPRPAVTIASGGNPTVESCLSSRFPTWGSMLCDHGYSTWWWGKWHLGFDADNHPEALDAHGFSGGTFPSPNGGHGEGLCADPGIVDQFGAWFARESTTKPWCTTVSLVNPHDIVYWPRWEPPVDVSQLFSSAAPNFETPDDLRAHGKPGVQLFKQLTFDPFVRGDMALTGRESQRQWARQLDVYLWLQQQADVQIGRIMEILASNSDVDRNTVVVFTSDHGEYAGSHGLSGKGGGAYEEAIRVPLYIRDPAGGLTPRPGQTRNQLTSSVDLVPLFLTIATGGNQWRAEDHYSHLAKRSDIAAIARSPAAGGRPWVAHTTDDLLVEEAEPRNEDTDPPHITAVRARKGKLAVYSHWQRRHMSVDSSAPQQYEVYDYSTELGKREIFNQAGVNNKLHAELQEIWRHEVLEEIHAPLPARLRLAQDEGMDNMLDMMESRDNVAKVMTQIARGRQTARRPADS